MRMERVKKIATGKLAALLVVALCGCVRTLPADAATPVQVHGQLSIADGKLVDANGKPVQLRGMSSHGLQWYGQFVNKDAMKWLRDDWGISVFRLAMYTEEEGYITDPSVADKVKEAVEAAQSLGLYVIIDWHILSDGDPNKHKTAAKAFFNEMAELYGNSPNVIYEIANEPNGDVTWNDRIRPYALALTQTIRAKDPDNLILVGTGSWSQDVQDAADNPLPDRNTMYVLHFYAGTHKLSLRERLDYALNRGVPIFVSEWGTSEAAGDKGPFLAESRVWLDFLNQRGISWVNWSLSDKAEISSALAPGADTRGGWTDADLTTSGKFVRKRIRGEDDTLATAPENGTPQVALQYINRNRNPADNAIHLAFNIKNTGGGTINLSDLKVRYYFNDDGKSSDQRYIDWADMGADKVIASSQALPDGSVRANHYVEIAFGRDAGEIPAGAESGEVQVRIHPADWSNYDETNDYSCLSDITVFTDWDKMTVYHKGSLIWGTEP
ncbi:1,3-beta-glucanase [Brenneria goodwinii]|uniref:Endoglucanase n=2 Tax=Brenneria goodwinii TaxID=1109412 RepID=A0AAE8ER70_9GAMM|nr:cellulase family glycosylhydrolase [Brenneria goodwinii]ATA23843.1 1,3-beta-glucanase [Brenneria goodwinii]RLM28435.1 1,3-beta-glucanase [Brenneria goodwinii]